MDKNKLIANKHQYFDTDFILQDQSDKKVKKLQKNIAKGEKPSLKDLKLDRFEIIYLSFGNKIQNEFVNFATAFINSELEVGLLNAQHSLPIKLKHNLNKS